MTAPSYVVHVSASGNVFMEEIATVLVAALGDLGRDARLSVGCLPEPAPGQLDLVVAPHELFTLFDLPDAQRRAIARQVVCVGTEQPGTPWFDLSWRWASLGPLALDINPLAVAELRRRRTNAHLLRLGYHETWDRWHGDDRARPTDVLFLGAETPRRATLLSELGGELAELDCDLRLFGFEEPVGPTTPGFLVGDAKYDRLATAKVLLNLHRSEVPYFEWMRAIEAIANGCVLVTEPAQGLAPLVPGTHLVAAPGRELLCAAREVLVEPARRDDMAGAAYELVRRELHLTRMLEEALPSIEATVSNARRWRLPAVRAQAGVQARRGMRLGKRGARRARDVVVPRLPRRRGAGSERETALAAQERKMATLARRRADREQAAALVEAAHGSPDHVEVHATSAFTDPSFAPEITVVVPLYNYEDEVGAAIESVLAATDVVVELIVIDDCSTDGSRRVAQGYVDAHPDFPIALVAKLANAGLSAARNTGFERARADRVFLLDADNAVYRKGLRRLSDALDADPAAAFAYGIIERFGEETGLTSSLAWDPVRLADANYIDAMALVRVEAWREVGGYDPEFDARFGGWEDYDFWLKLAAAGRHGTQVRQVVARYHQHGGSMLSLLNLETQSVEAELRVRYPNLPWT